MGIKSFPLGLRWWPDRPVSSGSLTYRSSVNSRHTWQSTGVISQAQATDNLDLDAPFITKPPGHPALMSFVKINERWTYRLKPGTDFIDANWSSAFKQNLSSAYGLALACDGTYVWGTRANEVWRMLIPGALQIPPEPGNGAGDTTVINQSDILKVQETIRPMAKGELYLELNNVDGTYSNLPTANIKKGSQVKLKYGYMGKGHNMFNPGNIYFLEDWIYSRAANKSSVILYCIDAWGLLENFSMPAPAEVNFISDDYTVYTLIALLLQCVGGSLSYRSKSAEIDTIYPRLNIRAGESAACIIKRLLEFIPDVLIFDGLNACIIYPQESDNYVYDYYFPNK